MKFLILLLVSLLYVANCKKLGVRVIRHQPCKNEKNSASIIFDSSDKAPVRENPAAGEGCYRLDGTVVVEKEIKGTLNLYVESKNGTRAEPIECKNADSRYCGGIGSCVYCDACNTGSQTEVVKSSGFSLLNNGKHIDCKTGLKPGTYKDISMTFCAPEVDDFLKSENIDKKAWDELIGSRGTTIYMVVHIFDTPINKLSKSELTKAIESEIGCHKLILNVYNRN